MKITNIELLHCDAGWRIWSFVKISTDGGIVGWSECTDAFGSTKGVDGVIQDLKPLLLNQDPREYERLFWVMYSRTRQSPGSVVQKAIAGIENALLDIKGKALGISVAEIFGGPIREKIPLYWSHCGTTRVRAAKLAGVKPITSLDDIKEFTQEIRERGYKVIKTNPAFFEGEPFIYMPGFNKSIGGPELNADRKIIDSIVRYVAAWREAAGDDMDIILDLNFNFKTEGYIAIGRALEPYRLMWLEIDSYDPSALLQIKNSVRIPVCSGETLYTARDFRPYFEQHAMDIASIDVTWNGFAQSKKIADMAELYEMNVAPHNHHSHLGTYISGNFAAAIANLRILETDVDDVPWKDELVAPPLIKDGVLERPRGAGWGADINEDVLRAHPPRG